MEISCLNTLAPPISSLCLFLTNILKEKIVSDWMYLILNSSQKTEYVTIVWRQAIYRKEFFETVANFSP